MQMNQQNKAEEDKILAKSGLKNELKPQLLHPMFLNTNLKSLRGFSNENCSSSATIRGK